MAWQPYRQFTTIKTLSELDVAIRSGLQSIPQGIDVVAGIPRSGMLPATLIATYLDLPLCSVDSFLRGETYGHGVRSTPVSGCRHALVVDDSIMSGRQLQKTKNALIESGSSADFTFACVFGTSETRKLCDLQFAEVEPPRIFVWNIVNSWVASHACVDIDGVLCKDPTSDENDDGPRYLSFLNSAHPLFACRHKIKYIVSSRLEKYRKETCEWLDSVGVSYDELILCDLPTAAARRSDSFCHGRYKAKIFNDCDAKIFIESTAWQSKIISDNCPKDVFCTENGRHYQPTRKQIQKLKMNYYLRHPKSALRLLKRKALGAR